VVEGGRLFFGGTSPAEGRELWVSDGTEGGTGPVADIRPGPESGFVDPTGGPWYFTHPDHVAGQGRVFFIGDDGVHGEEPWTSDGTEAGTGALGDVRPGSLGSEPRWLTALGGDLYFTADDGVHGRELWRSGPAGPPALVADLVPGPGSSRPFDLLAVDGVLYYSAFTPETGVELWRTDGTAAGTGLVQDIHPGPESSTPEKLTVSGRRLYFTAHDGVHGFEPWALILPTRRPRATLTAQRVGPGTFDLTLTLFNPPPEELPDGDGDELALPLPAGLEPLAASATSGTVAVIAGGGAPLAAGRTTAAASLLHLVTWNGSLAAGASVVVTVRVRIDPEMPGPFSVQADGTYDSDGDGGSDESFTSDDPDLPGEANPTQLAAQVVEVPALSTACLALLILVLAIAGCHRLLSRS
jgi:ELWxxDGT repeat protein